MWRPLRPLTLRHVRSTSRDGLVLAAAAAATASLDATHASAVQGVCRRWPFCHVVWNTFCRAAVARGIFSHKLVANLRALHPSSTPAALLLGASHSLAARPAGRVCGLVGGGQPLGSLPALSALAHASWPCSCTGNPSTLHPHPFTLRLLLCCTPRQQAAPGQQMRHGCAEQGSCSVPGSRWPRAAPAC